MHPAECPDWEYTRIAGHSEILAQSQSAIFADLRARRINSGEVSSDTRPFHERMFRDLAPADCSYFAGHYRGEDFKCRRYLQVGIPSDPRVGSAPDLVRDQMSDLANLIQASVAGLDEGHRLPNAQLDASQKAMYSVCIACRIFEAFLRVHPYANGNGHAARLCLIALLGRYSYWLRAWPVEPRPADPPYTDLIVQYRNGNPEPLESFIFRSIIP